MIDYGWSNSIRCSDKRVYRSNAEALRADKRHLRSIKNRRERLKPYKCLSCTFWHLGHPPRKERLYGSRKKYTDRHNQLSD